MWDTYPPVQFELTEQLQLIYNRVIQESEQIIQKFPMGKHIKSRDNLISYLSLTPHLRSDLSNQLIQFGMTPIEQASTHILYTLQKILENLHAPAKKPTQLLTLTPRESKELIQTRSERIFGKSEANIMVTLDANMLNQPNAMELLLLNGMNIARINCAHDNDEVWLQLIEGVRNAEKHLRTQKNFQKPSCKIYIDLAGPKVRIGKIEQEKVPLKVSVPTDTFGNTIKNAIGYLDCNVTHTHLLPDQSFVLAIKNANSLIDLTEDDELIFTDSRKRKRSLKVVEVVNHHCVKVKLNRTAFFDESTILYHENNDFQIHSLLPSPKEIFVKKGDLLRIYLQSDRLGHPATDLEPAGVTVSLIKAFRNVRINDRIFIDDGKIHGVVHKITKNYIEIVIHAPIIEETRIKEGKGLNLPDSLLSLNLPALTEKDINDLSFVVKHANIIGISFVHSPLDLIKLRNELKMYTNNEIPIVAKIETKDAIHQLARIILEGLNFCDFGIMIARGDLAVEVGYENLAVVQEEILAICAASHIPTIWATGVLERMTKKGVPSRSEITDAFHGKRANCLMLNKGAYIFQSLHLLTDLLKTNHKNSIDHIQKKRAMTFSFGFVPQLIYNHNNYDWTLS